jgi:hypothetical protein
MHEQRYCIQAKIGVLHQIQETACLDFHNIFSFRAMRVVSHGTRLVSLFYSTDDHIGLRITWSAHLQQHRTPPCHAKYSTGESDMLTYDTTRLIDGCIHRAVSLRPKLA